MKTTDLDRIATSAPLTREASRARDGSGELWSWEPPAHVPRWFAPPKMKPIRSLSAPGQAVAAEMIGKRFGRLVVLGVLAKKRNQAALWVCRCDCGYYEGRKARALRQDQSGDMACTMCEKVKYLREAGRSAPTSRSRKAEAGRLDELSAKTNNRT